MASTSAPAGPVGGTQSAADAAGQSRSLSPSRASDFMSCPLKYRFRVVDQLPEAPSPAATRGTVVHGVLERLFDLPREERTLERAIELLGPAWEAELEADEQLAAVVAGQDAAESALWLSGADELLSTYFRLEDPARLEPAARERKVEVELPDGLRLRGIIDRVDRAADGALRVVDYKTGKAPGEGFEASAMFQMKFYALVLWRLEGVLVRELKLMYLSDGQTLTYRPEERELEAFERRVRALWEAIERAHETGDWRPKRSRLCDWCDHQVLCPEFGGTPPPVPVWLPTPRAS